MASAGSGEAGLAPPEALGGVEILLGVLRTEARAGRTWAVGEVCRLSCQEGRLVSTRGGRRRGSALGAGPVLNGDRGWF